ncbi:site-specific DNA-methyltransferase [Schaalia hyovaginalis]|uniref:site-specific DNA-methyltransferase n=1 Tax=Schaalia hyovaginalis TaxID=29316 RepID=UPI0026ECFAF1|nr:site-specific DNA-methyltransferase [Schaalia hyovaginalis]MDD7554368.1 site-specific DNA-methyltransferase [Schaalia hyovaginalis]MDY3093554.1 site-specific DNA-methyltransferase [Schaalia hyovaginalis]MDY5473037.1 site-specific DNA-methyltransferase [Collinsella sp.]
MADDIEKMDLKSKDLVAERVDEMRELFPEVFSEGGIDFEKLRLVLGDEVDDEDERYAFTWPGKRDAIRQSQTPSTATLRPYPKESVNWDTTQNLYIEGDNLEVLKLLLRAYSGRVRMIYIDPPYNTGKDFVYKDSFGDSVKNYHEQVGSTGQSNAESNGRFHSDWCSMIYPRLRLARELLCDEGAIFISIGEEEVSTLKAICLELFGDNNFVGNIVWQSRTSISNDDEISSNHNHTLVFSKNRSRLQFGGDEIDSSDYSNPDDDPRGPWKCVPIDANHAGGDTQFPIRNPKTGVDYYPPNGRSWAYNRETVAELMADNRIAFGTTGTSAPKRKLFLNERKAKGDTKTPSSLLLDAGTTKNGTEEIMSLLGDKVFDFPKPSSLIERLLDYGMHSGEGIFLDFFSGSASSSHAVLTKNLKDGGSRTFIAVQLNEDLDKAKVDASIDAKKTIERACKLLDSIDRPHYLTEIGKERIRRVGKQVIGEVDEENKQLRIDAEPKQVPDIGFRVLKLDASCIATAKPGEMLLDRLKPDRSDEDIIFEMMLKWGLDLTYPVEKTEIANYPCYSVAGDALICCMKPGLTVDVIEAIAAREPDRVFMLDSVLDDSLKLNALQIFKRVEERTQRKIDLRTV